ncbi:MAG: hypothetical protein DRZ76_03890, partial [Candidatus Nealsonbacteria bacterium]
MSFSVKNQKGQSLIELLVAMGVFVLVISGIMFLTLDAHTANLYGQERTKATLLAQEGIEAVKSIKNRGWRYLPVGSYGLDDSNGYWELKSGYDSIDNIFTRQITIEHPSRDVNGNIVETGGIIDYDTKKITAEVNWYHRAVRPSEVVIESYLTNWRSRKWIQTTQADFDQGAKNNVVTTAIEDGEVQLEGIEVPTYFDWTFDNPLDYQYDPAKIEVADSQARLVNLGLIDSGQTENPAFDVSPDPWEYFDWDEDPGEV